MKKQRTALLALSMSLLVLTSCGKTGVETARSDSQGCESNVSVPNPVKRVTAEEMASVSGIPLLAPADASDVAYDIIDTGGDHKMAQVSFTYHEKPFTYRAQASEEAEAYDMTGLYYTWDEEKDTEVGYCKAKLMLCSQAAGLSWMDAVPGIHYALGCAAESNEEEMLEVANLVFAPLQDGADASLPDQSGKLP